jgi:hypothetical protein
LKNAIAISIVAQADTDAGQDLGALTVQFDSIAQLEPLAECKPERVTRRVHGLIGTVGAFGHEASVRADESDVLSSFNYRLMCSSAFIYDVAHSGLVLGATFNAKLAELFRKIGDA